MDSMLLWCCRWYRGRAFWPGALLGPWRPPSSPSTPPPPPSPSSTPTGGQSDNRVAQLWNLSNEFSGLHWPKMPSTSHSMTTGEMERILKVIVLCDKPNKNAWIKTFGFLNISKPVQSYLSKKSWGTCTLKSSDSAHCDWDGCMCMAVKSESGREFKLGQKVKWLKG